MKRFEAINLPLKIRCEGAEAHTLLQMASERAGITIVPRRSWKLSSHLHYAISEILMEGDPIELITGVAWKKSSYRYMSQATIDAKEKLLTIERNNYRDW